MPAKYVNNILVKILFCNYKNLKNFEYAVNSPIKILKSQDQSNQVKQEYIPTYFRTYGEKILSVLSK